MSVRDKVRSIFSARALRNSPERELFMYAIMVQSKTIMRWGDAEAVSEMTNAIILYCYRTFNNPETAIDDCIRLLEMGKTEIRLARERGKKER